MRKATVLTISRKINVLNSNDNLFFAFLLENNKINSLKKN